MIWVWAVLLGLAVGVAAVAAIYAFWLKPALARERGEADRKASAALIDAREEALRLREAAEDELRQKRSALELQEARLSARSEAADAREQRLDQQEAEARERLQHLTREEEEAATKLAEAEQALEKAAKLKRDEARQQLISQVEDEAREIALRRAKQIELSVAQEAERRARMVVLESIQRLAVDYVIEATTALVELPSEDMKGRIIGREGRNIRAFEQVTGVDLLVDESPDSVSISSFDPVRREIARLTLMNLMLDGRIHPGRIEELHEKAAAEVERTIIEAGERAAERANVPGIATPVVETLGRLRFRTSYAQNVLDHSVEVSRLCALLASELGLNVEVAKRAGLLHDIGKALGPEWEGPHALTGMEYLGQQGESAAVTHAVGAHHREIEPESPEAQIVIVADAISAARPGARRESLDNYVKRLAKLEQLAASFPGVERSYAVQAGREVRLIVKPGQIDDLGAVRLADEVARAIERDLEYPGQIKVTVIRETRAQGVAK